MMCLMVKLLLIPLAVCWLHLWPKCCNANSSSSNSRERSINSASVAAPRQMERAQINVGSTQCCQQPSSITPRLCRSPLAPPIPLSHLAPHINCTYGNATNCHIVCPLSEFVKQRIPSKEGRFIRRELRLYGILPMYNT